MVKVLYEVISDMSSGLPPMYDSLGSTNLRRAVDDQEEKYPMTNLSGARCARRPAQRTRSGRCRDVQRRELVRGEADEVVRHGEGD